MTPASTDSGSKSLSTCSDRDTRHVLYGEDENKDRGNWSGRLDFVLSLIGSVSSIGFL